MKQTGSTWPLDFAAPRDVGMDPDRCARIERAMQAYIDEGRLAGIITLIARHGRIAHLHRCGQQDMERDVPMADDAIFRIYSMTKIVCAVAVLMLYEEGAYQLTDPISRFFPAFKDLKVRAGDGGESENLNREITIHDLLTHTGGLSYEVAPHANTMTRDAFIGAVCKVPLLCQPGQAWNYSASNDVLGAMIEVVTGQTLGAFLKARIFDPLGMVDTGFHVPPEKVGRLAALYKTGKDGALEPAASIGEHDFLKEPAFASAGGGLVSTSPDYLAFAQMLLNGGTFKGQRIMSRKSIELMTANHLPPGHPALDINGEVYGLGVEVLRSLGEARRLGSVGEFGWGGAACTQVWVDPAEDMIALIMLQYFSEGKGCDVMIKFRGMSCQTVID